MIKIARPPCKNPKALTKNYKDKKNKNALIHASHGKCMYCESKIAATSYGDVEHIKPKSLYPNYEFDWDNLGFSCTKCNNAKHDKFSEQLPYINPYDEDPELYLTPDGALLISKNGHPKGEKTIVDIDLNRTALIQQRLERFNSVKKYIEVCYKVEDNDTKRALLSDLINEAKPDKEYSLIIKHLLMNHNIEQ